MFRALTKNLGHVAPQVVTNQRVDIPFCKLLKTSLPQNEYPGPDGII